MSYQILEAVDDGVHFDEHQFAGTERPVSAKTRISRGDYARMHQERHSYRRYWIPAWALNDKQLRHVIAQRCWDYLLNFEGGLIQLKSRGVVGWAHSPVPSALIENRELLEALAEKALANIHAREAFRINQYAARTTHLATLKAYSYLSLHAALIWRCYRLGERAKDVAEDLGVSAGSIRQSLLRANLTAARLGYETLSKPHWTKGIKRPHVLFQKADELRTEKAAEAATRAA
jgi:hypothetical protein